MYAPVPPRLLEVPKDQYVSRPFALLRLKDRAVYQAIVNELMLPIDQALPDTVFSSRLGKDGSPPRRPTKAWLQFQRAGLHHYLVDGLGFMVSTDVASYFEYVDVPILVNDLRQLKGVPSSLVDLLHRVLDGVNQARGVWGLPQGRRLQAFSGIITCCQLTSR
jgi:hypothetical protein